MTRPAAAADLLSKLLESAPGRVVRKLDKDPQLSDAWQWGLDGDVVRVDTGRETVTLHPDAGRVNSPEQVRCTCLLSPRCLHVLAVVRGLEVADANSPPGDEADEPAGSSDDESITEAQQAAAARCFEAAAAMLSAGAAGAGTVLQADLLQALHHARALGLHHLSGAGVGVVQAVRDLQAHAPSFELRGLAAGFAELLGAAHALARGEPRRQDRTAYRNIVGTARRRYEPVGSMRLSGLLTEAVVSARGYAGTVSVMIDDNGALWTLADVMPGGAGRAAAAYTGGLGIGDVSMAPLQLNRAGLFLSGATGSKDGRLGAGKGVKAVRAESEGWQGPAVRARFAEPWTTQLTRALAPGERTGDDWVFCELTVIGSDRGAMIAEVAQAPGPLRCTASTALGQANLALLSGHPGLKIEAVLRVSPDAPGSATALTVAPTGDTPRLDEKLGGVCNIDLDPLQPSQFDGAARPREVRIAAPVTTDPLEAMRRRVDRVAIGGAQTLSLGAAAELQREAKQMSEHMWRAGGALLVDLAKQVRWTKQTQLGTRASVPSAALAKAWLACAVYLEHAQRVVAQDAWSGWT